MESSSSSPGGRDILKPVMILGGNTEVDKKKNAMEVFKILAGRVTRSINEANPLMRSEWLVEEKQQIDHGSGKRYRHRNGELGC